MWLVSSFNFSILYFREKKDNHFQVVMTACSTMWKWWESSALKGAQRQGSLMGLLILFILSFFSCNHSYVRICIAILSEINKFWVLCWNPFKFKLLCCRLVTANVSHLNYCRILLTHWMFLLFGIVHYICYRYPAAREVGETRLYRYWWPARKIRVSRVVWPCQKLETASKKAFPRTQGGSEKTHLHGQSFNSSVYFKANNSQVLNYQNLRHFEIKVENLAIIMSWATMRNTPIKRSKFTWSNLWFSGLRWPGVD